MNLPNKLTVLRVAMVPFFVFFALADFVPHRFLIAGLLFGAASYTDHLDGKIARRDGLVTNFGKLMDPLADKIMVLSALLCFLKLGFANVVLVLLILVREFAVTAVRQLAAESGEVVAANNWGKAKTVAEIVAVCVIFAMQWVLEMHRMGLYTLPAFETFSAVFGWAGEALVAVATVFAVASGLVYFKDNARLFRDR